MPLLSQDGLGPVFLLVVLLALLVLRDTASHGARRRGRAGVRFAGARPHIHASTGAALCRTLLYALRPVFVRLAPLNVRCRCAPRTGMPQSASRPQVRPTVCLA